MSPKAPTEPLAQRRLAILLREACYRRDHDAVLRLVAEHPIGARASHVRHNLSAEARAYLDSVMMMED